MIRPGARGLINVALLGAIFLTAMSATILATAAPSITRLLDGLALYSWMFAAYLLSMTVTTPLYGKLADLYGRKPTYLLGVALFAGGAALAGLATSMEQLIACRFVQGLGAGAIQPIAMTIIGDLYPLAERARIQGWMSAMWALASLAGPALGGFIVATLDWRWVFWVNVPVALASAAIMAYAMREEVVPRRHQLDWGGRGHARRRRERAAARDFPDRRHARE